MIRTFGNNRGMALVLTIAIVSIILFSTLQFNTDMRSDVQAAANLSDGVRLGYLARSAFNTARLVLLEDAKDSNFDSWHETWAQLPFLASSFPLLGGSRMNLSIADLSARIQINAIGSMQDPVKWQKQYDLLTRFLLLDEFGLSDKEAEGIAEAITDWVDKDDDETGLGGAENSHYQSLDPPYSCKNGPVEFIEELLLVKGITSDLYYGTDEHPGIAGFLSPHGDDGLVNINTADAPVLQALNDEIDRELAESMVAHREENSGELARLDWYLDVSGFPGDVVILADLITVASTYFEIGSEAFAGRMSRKISGVVKRESVPDIRVEIVSWEIE